MNLRNSSNPVNSLMIFIGGAVLGGVVVALTTPKRGADLRKDLNRLGGKAKDRMGEWAKSASEALGGVTLAGKEKAEKATASVKTKAEDMSDKGQIAWKEIKKGTLNAGNDIKDGLSVAGKELRT